MTCIDDNYDMYANGWSKLS
uniref:Uncharacterized protein n=1 Tax=Wuchereria bancrofti TaxID=6293 RepID=A0AAF5RUF1_WUCBA